MGGRRSRAHPHDGSVRSKPLAPMAAAWLVVFVLAASTAHASICDPYRTLRLNPRPQLTGQHTMAATPTTSSGKWSTCLLSGITYSYQWVVNGQPVAGAVSPSYVVRPADEGFA